MEDVILILILLLAGFLLVKYLAGSFASKAGTYTSEIGSAASTAIKDITAAGSNTAKELGTLAHNVENNLFNGYADATKHSTVQKAPTQSTYTNAVKNQLQAGIITGNNLAAGPAGTTGAAAGSAPIDFLAGLSQGVQSSYKAAESIPAFKALGNRINDLGNFGANSLDRVIGAGVHGVEDVGSWIGHLF